MPRVDFTILAVLLIASIAFGQDNGACPEGFSGPKCSLCSSDTACSASTGNSGATCNTDFPFLSSSKVKSYVCNPTGPDLVLGLIAPDSLLIQCHTLARSGNSGGGVAAAPPTPIETAPASAPAPEVSAFSPPSVVPPAGEASPPTESTGAPTPAPGPSSGGLVVNGTDISGLLDAAGQALAGRKRLLLQDPAAPAAGESPYCDIGFQVQDPALQVQCKANDCALQVGSSSVTCQKTTCECEGDPTCANNGLVSSLITLVNGKAELVCTPGAAGQPAPCTLKLEGLPINEIQAECKAAECIIPEDDNAFNGSNSTTPDVQPPPPVPYLNINPVIAAIPLMFLTVIVGFVGTYTYMHRSMWSASAAAAGAASGAAAGAASKHGKKVKTLEFRDICVKVPMDVTVSTKKHQALRQKALARHDTANITMQATNSGGARSIAGILSRQARHRLGFKGSEEDLQLSPEEHIAAMAASESQDLTSAADFVSQLHGNPDSGTWTVVEDCTGIASAGEVVGVLGPSGCGKTTLLTSIVGSSLELGSTALMTGAVLIDGIPRQGQDVAYVPQADTLIPTLTVAECVRYSALLRLPRTTPIEQVHCRVAGVLEELGLTHVADSAVGGSGNIRGVSGGERRRVTIGMELVTDPSIIVLDEPTSGLDSYTAINLIRSLRTVAAGGRVVIASLHQPSKDMFYALDSVILMGHGRMLFKGRPEEAESALAMAGVPVPEDTAVAEYMLKVASNPADIKLMLKYKYKSSSAAMNTLNGGLGGSGTGLKSAGGSGGGAVSEDTINAPFTTSTITTADGTAFAVTTSTISQTAEAAVDGSNTMEAASPPEQRSLSANNSHSFSNVAVEPSPRPAGFARQLAVMFWRTSMDIIRNPTLLVLHVGIAAIVGILNGAIFYQVEPDFSGVQNRMGATFFALALLAFTSLTTVDLLMNERNVVMREVRSGYYGPVAYLLSKLALDGMLLRAIPAVVFWAPFYYMTGFRTGAPYAATYVFTMVAFNCCIGALSMAVTVGCNTAGQAAFVMNFTLLFMLVFTGFLVKISSVTPVLGWIHFLSPFFYAFEAMLSTELNGQLIDFAYQPTPDVPVTVIPDLKGETFLTSLGLSTTNTTRDIGILVALYVAFMILALGLFLFKMPRSSNRAAAKKVGKKAAPAAGQEKGSKI